MERHSGSEQASRFIASLCGKEGIPRVREAVVLGSGLGEAIPGLDRAVEIPFSEIPGWPEAGVPGHEGVLVFGECRGRGVLMQKGRLHYYEGLEMGEVTFPVRRGEAAPLQRRRGTQPGLRAGVPDAGAGSRQPHGGEPPAGDA